MLIELAIAALEARLKGILSERGLDALFQLRDRKNIRQKVLSRVRLSPVKSMH